MLDPRFFQTSWRVLHAMVSGERIPLGVGWNITHRCNLRCVYCETKKTGVPEMPTEEVTARIDEMAALGTRFINFSGGEPLLRDDLPRILAHSLDRGLRVSLFSNGLLVAKRIDALRGVHEIQLSVDGPEAVTDAQRGPGVFRAVVEAIEACLGEGISVALSAVVTSENVRSAAGILDLADRYGVGVYFHPADPELAGDGTRLLACSPSPEEFRAFIDDLIAEKKRGRRSIAHSVSGLRHLRNWPEPTPIPCLVSLLFCNVEPDGRVLVCDQMPGDQRRYVPMNGSFADAFRALPSPVRCRQCWCGSTIEYNLVRTFRPDAMLGVLRRFGTETHA